MLRASVADLLAHTWPQENPPSAQPVAKERTEGRYEGLYERIQALAPKNDAQLALQTQSLKTAADMAQMRWLMFSQKGSSIPTPFLVVMVCWLALILASFSLFAVQCNCVQHLTCLRIGGFQRSVSDPGTGSTVRRHDPVFQRPTAQYP